MISHQTIVSRHGKNGMAALGVKVYYGGDLEGIVDCLHPMKFLDRMYYRWFTADHYQYSGGFAVGLSRIDELNTQLERFHIVPTFSKLRSFENYKRVKIKVTGIQFSTLILAS